VPRAPVLGTFKTYGALAALSTDRAECLAMTRGGSLAYSHLANACVICEHAKIEVFAPVSVDPRVRSVLR